MGARNWQPLLAAALAWTCRAAVGQPPDPAPVEGIAPAGCVTADCHPGVVEHDFAHGPAAQRKCQACHVVRSTDEHTFDLRLPEERFCTSCHIVKRPDFLHTPVREGRCTECHDPHGSGFRFMLRADPVEDLCRRCHDPADIANGTHVHVPVASGACVLCHDAHGSWRPNLLVQPGRELCTSCHGAVQSDLVRKAYDHQPVADGQCTACHDAHASDAPLQLVEAVPALCTGCHPDVGERIDHARVTHAAVRDDRACLNCHDAHAGGFPGLLDQPTAELCLECHDRRIPLKEGGQLQDMAALLRENPFHHGPIRNGDCNACHDPHGNDHFRLLVQEYPPEFYAPFQFERYALCFSCHVREMVEEPYGIGITGFSTQTDQGVQNLHFVHVVNEKKGRTCRACHEVHASAHPFHIRDAVPFGEDGWPLQINFVATAEGGRCAPACHAPRSYHRPAAVSEALSQGEP